MKNNIKKNNKNSWKTTKEVAEALGLATDTILSFRNTHKELFEELVMVSPVNTIKGVRNALLWSPEAIKILAFNISNPNLKIWKGDIIKEFAKKGIVMAKTSNLLVIKAQAELISNIIDYNIQQQQEIDAMQIELSDTSEILDKHIQKEKQYLPIADETISTIRRLIQFVYDFHHRTMWRELHSKFNFSKLDRMTETKGQLIIKYIKNKYNIDKKYDSGHIFHYKD